MLNESAFRSVVRVLYLRPQEVLVLVKHALDAAKTLDNVETLKIALIQSNVSNRQGDSQQTAFIKSLTSAQKSG